MPSYFYHLKFELYPYPHKQSPTNDASHKIRSTWVPERESDIFSTKVWPTHPLTSKELKGREKCQTDWANAQHYRRTLDNSSSVGSADTQRSGGGSVIDCGPSRASPTCEDEEILAIRPIASSKALHFPTPLPQRKLGDLESAKKDWRFDKVRIESFDMTPTRANSQQRPVHTRGESSGGVTTPTNSQNGMNAGLSSAGVGRVTKAQYEVLEGKNTEVGWGIVHLYRDGEETPALGDLAAKAGAQRVLDDSSSPPSVGGLRMKDDADGETEDCTTLCIPAVPSYLTPSDFLGFVGEKTREQVSHFRMVMTGRMNRYLVLMKFRDNGEARRWRAEWDGKVFNSMEVRHFLIGMRYFLVLTFRYSQRLAMLLSSSQSHFKHPTPLNQTPASQSSLTIPSSHLPQPQHS
jgi:BRCA1-associated protein